LTPSPQNKRLIHTPLAAVLSVMEGEGDGSVEEEAGGQQQTGGAGRARVRRNKRTPRNAYSKTLAALEKLRIKTVKQVTELSEEHQVGPLQCTRGLAK